VTVVVFGGGALPCGRGAARSLLAVESLAHLRVASIVNKPNVRLV
jgi:hypothetical protein